MYSLCIHNIQEGTDIQTAIQTVKVLHRQYLPCITCIVWLTACHVCIQVCTLILANLITRGTKAQIYISWPENTANISICRFHWVVLLIFKWTETVLFALNLSFWWHGHVCLLFTNEEQKMACDAFDPLPHISPLALFMTSLIQTAVSKVPF